MERNNSILNTINLDSGNGTSLHQIIAALPEGYFEGMYNNSKYGITKTTFNNARSFKIFAKEQGGKDFISLNYYVTKNDELLKPCEMPEGKVIHFLRNLRY